MDIDIILNICRELPRVTEDIKWGNDLCFMIGGKIFCEAALSTPLKVSLKVTDEEFGEMSTMPGIIPAPYVARFKWILVEDTNIFNKQKWEHYIRQSYNMVKEKLPKKILAQLG